MNLNWAVGLLIAAVGNVVIPRQNDNVLECLEPGCTRRLMTAKGRRKHFRTVHQGIRKSCNKMCLKLRHMRHISKNEVQSEAQSEAHETAF